MKSYQGKHHLTQDGIVGPMTWGKLCGTSGSSGPAAEPSQSSGGASQQNHGAAHAPTVSDKPSEGGRAVIDAARGLRDHLISVTSGYGTTFNGYGSGTNQYVCTTYVSKVLRNVGFPFEKGDAVDRNINIRGLDLGADPPTKLGELVRAGNEKTKGVVHALTIKKWGTEAQTWTQFNLGLLPVLVRYVQRKAHTQSYENSNTNARTQVQLEIE